METYDGPQIHIADKDVAGVCDNVEPLSRVRLVDMSFVAGTPTFGGLRILRFDMVAPFIPSNEKSSGRKS